MFLDLDPATLIARLIVLAVAFTIHEFAHAWTAVQFGDDTPRYYGRLTLNPLAHLDPMGSLVLIFAGFGWAKPVPIDPYRLQRRSSAAVMWVSLAGPFSNFLLAIIAAVPFRLGWANVYDAFGASAGILPNFSKILVEFVSINLILMLFNLIPLAPLDGEKIAYYFFPPTFARILDDIRPYSPMILMVIVLVLPFFGLDIIGWLLGPPLQSLFMLLVG
jgi:Zn-dependent protease